MGERGRRVPRPEGASTGLGRAAVFGGVLVLTFSMIAGPFPAAGQQFRQPRLTVAGVAEDPCQQQRALPVPAGLSGQFEPDSSVLRMAGEIYVTAKRSGSP